MAAVVVATARHIRRTYALLWSTFAGPAARLVPSAALDRTFRPWTPRGPLLSTGGVAVSIVTTVPFLFLRNCDFYEGVVGGLSATRAAETFFDVTITGIGLGA